MPEGCVFSILAPSRLCISVRRFTAKVHRWGRRKVKRDAPGFSTCEGELPLATRDDTCIPPDTKVIFSNPRNDRKEYP